MLYEVITVGKLANLHTPLVHVLFHSKCASVKKFKKLNEVTWKMHLWIDKEITPAPWYIKLFWLGQYISGKLFSAEFNWAFYRLLKKFVYLSSVFFDLFHQISPKKTVPRVIVQPAILSTSGQ